MATRGAAVGTRAPDFSLPCVDGPAEAPRQVSLGDYLDGWLVLLFYPRDFSLV
jgi:peroxiredoxin